MKILKTQASLILTFSIEESCESKFLLGHIEGIVEVVHGVALVEFVVLNEVGPVLVDEGIERQAIPPAGGEVAHVDIVVASRLHLAPQQQSILCRLGLTAVSLLHSNVLDLKRTASSH
jgi:hypothetical protein